MQKCMFKSTTADEQINSEVFLQFLLQEWAESGAALDGQRALAAAGWWKTRRYDELQHCYR